MNSKFRNSPNLGVNSLNRDPIAKELKWVNLKLGKFSVGKSSVKILRSLTKYLLPKPDDSNVSVEDFPEIGKGVLVVTPKNKSKSGAYFLIHGGGYVLGSNKDVLSAACDIARDCGVTVVCPSYSLAPENPFPIGLNELYESWDWLLKNSSQFDIDQNKIVIGGISAGGGMAAAIVQKIHDEGGVQPAAQLLIYPMLDDRVALRNELDKPRHSVWSNKNNRFGWTSYLQQEPGGEVEPYSVPGRRENLSGLPDTWIGVGTCDLFLDECRNYYEKLITAGVNVDYLEVEGAIHGFESGETQMGLDFDKEKANFLNKYI